MKLKILIAIAAVAVFAECPDEDDREHSFFDGGPLAVEAYYAMGKPPSPRDIEMDSAASRKKSEIMVVANARISGLMSIYKKYLTLNPGFSGKVTLKFIIAPNGDIVSMAIVSSTTGYPDFDDAVKNKVATWKWKTIKSGNTTVTAPFRFGERQLDTLNLLNNEH